MFYLLTLSYIDIMYVAIFMKDIKSQLMFKSICLPGLVFKTYIVHHAIILRLIGINFYSVFCIMHQNWQISYKYSLILNWRCFVGNKIPCQWKLFMISMICFRTIIYDQIYKAYMVCFQNYVFTMVRMLYWSHINMYMWNVSSWLSRKPRILCAHFLY